MVKLEETKWFVFRDSITGKLDIMSPETARITGAFFDTHLKLIKSLSDRELEEFIGRKTASAKRQMAMLKRVI